MTRGEERAIDATLPETFCDFEHWQFYPPRGYRDDRPNRPTQLIIKMQRLGRAYEADFGTEMCPTYRFSHAKWRVEEVFEVRSSTRVVPELVRSEAERQRAVSAGVDGASWEPRGSLKPRNRSKAMRKQ